MRTPLTFSSCKRALQVLSVFSTVKRMTILPCLQYPSYVDSLRRCLFVHKIGSEFSTAWANVEILASQTENESSSLVREDALVHGNTKTKLSSLYMLMDAFVISDLMLSLIYHVPIKIEPCYQ